MPKARSAAMRKHVERITKVRTAAQAAAMKAEDVLTALEDREARRNARNAANSPRNS